MPVGVADDRICTAADAVSEADAHRCGDARSGESAFVADFQHGAGFQGRQDAGRGNSDQIGGRRGIENAVFPDFNPAARQTVKHRFPLKAASGSEYYTGQPAVNAVKQSPERSGNHQVQTLPVMKFEYFHEARISFDSSCFFSGKRKYFPRISSSVALRIPGQQARPARNQIMTSATE